MSDEALNAHLDWLDKCAEEQINECVKHEFMCATNEYLKCKHCPKTMHPDEAEAILNEHAALKRELRKKTQHVCSHCGYVTVSQDVEEAFASLKDEIRRHEEVFQFSANKIAALKRENDATNAALEINDSLISGVEDALEKAEIENAALKGENEHLSDLAYGPRHDSDCPALWGAGFCRCGLRDRIEEWKEKRAGIDALLTQEQE